MAGDNDYVFSLLFSFSLCCPCFSAFLQSPSNPDVPESRNPKNKNKNKKKTEPCIKIYIF